MILDLVITVFVTQVIFIGSRTWNVQATAKGDVKQTLISGSIVHISWLVSTAVGTVSMNEIIQGLSQAGNIRWEYVPVVVASLIGGNLGAYVALKRRNRK